MSKRTFVIFGIVVLFFGVALPYWAINEEGAREASPERVAGSDEDAKLLFQENCGSCHTLARAGSDGIVGPNLDELLGGTPPEGNRGRVLSAIENGVQGRMPAGILQGQPARDVADFVARVAGQ